MPMTSTPGTFEECADELNDFINTLDRYPHSVLAFVLRAHLAGLLQALLFHGLEPRIPPGCRSGPFGMKWPDYVSPTAPPTLPAPQSHKSPQQCGKGWAGQLYFALCQRADSQDVDVSDRSVVFFHLRPIRRRRRILRAGAVRAQMHNQIQKNVLRFHDKIQRSAAAHSNRPRRREERADPDPR